MPFDMAPQEVKTKYQDLADALLRGCQITKPITGMRNDGRGGACALGAIWIALGHPLGHPPNEFSPEYKRDQALQRDYFARYGTGLASDNNTRRFTREQIAARIADL